MADSPSPDPFDLIRKAHTAAGNCDMDTDDIIRCLERWLSQCSFTVTEARGDALNVRFTTLPADMDAFAREVYEFCPDLVDQGTGCVREMVEMAQEMGKALSPGMAELIEGVDFGDDNYGLEILKRQVVRDKELRFWWD